MSCSHDVSTNWLVDLLSCGETKTMSHVVESYPLMELGGGFLADFTL